MIPGQAAGAQWRPALADSQHSHSQHLRTLRSARSSVGRAQGTVRFRACAHGGDPPKGASMSWPTWPTAASCAAIPTSRSIRRCSTRSAPWRCRRRPSRDLQQADIVIVIRQGPAREARGAAAGQSLGQGGAGVPGVLRQQPPPPAALRLARPAVRERLSRPVLQRLGRCRHRAGDLRRRGRPGRAGHLPDQRHPQPRPAGVRHPGAARPCLPGGGAGRRLAVLRRA